MEDVDKIIFRNLVSLGWQTDEPCGRLGLLEPSDAATGVIKCLKAINAENDLPNSLPLNMAQRFKVAAVIAEKIKELHYPGDAGYQTVLYPNEPELRKLFMFLIEKIPKECSTIANEPTDKLSLLHRDAKKKLSESLKCPWIPLHCQRTVRKYMSMNNDKVSLIQQGYSECKGFIPTSESGMVSPNSSQQSNFIIPTLLAAHSEHLGTSLAGNSQNILASTNTQLSSISKKEHLPLLMSFPKSESMLKFLAEEARQHNLTDKSFANLIEDVDDMALEENVTSSVESLQNDLDGVIGSCKTLTLGLQESNKKISEIEVYLNEYSEKVQIQDIALENRHKLEAVAESYEDAKSKLQSALEANQVREEKRIQQWQRHKESLQNDIKELQHKLSIKDSKKIKMAQDLAQLRHKIQQMAIEIPKKETILTNLVQQSKIPNNEVSRCSYTRRIQDLSSNLRRQRQQTHKVIVDIKIVQKDINTLTGKLQRTFSRVENEVYKSAVKNEKAAPIYRYVTSIHESCGQLVEIIRQTGSVQREIADLRLQLADEKDKKIENSISRLQEDLARIKLDKSTQNVQT